MMMKIIFLDIDGVIATDRNSFNRETLWGTYKWCDEPVRVLKEIIDESDAEIVLSSDWRIDTDLPDMRDMFNYHGLDGKRLIGYTPYRITAASKIFQGRANEIVDWMKAHGQLPHWEKESFKWVAIDDLNMSEFLPNFVHMTNTALGLADPGKKKEVLEYLL